MQKQRTKSETPAYDQEHWKPCNAQEEEEHPNRVQRLRHPITQWIPKPIVQSIDT